MRNALPPYEDAAMDLSRLTALFLALALGFAGATDYIPAFIDAEGRVFGLFKLDVYKDALHFASAAWAAFAAWKSRRASVLFLRVFGVLYFLDGVMGVFTGSGFLDLSIFTQGWLDVSPLIKFLSRLPHLGLGFVALVGGYVFGRPGRVRIG